MEKALPGADINTSGPAHWTTASGQADLRQTLASFGVPAGTADLPCLGERLARLFGLGDTMELDAATGARSKGNGSPDAAISERLARDLDETCRTLSHHIDEYGATLLADPACADLGAERFIDAWLAVQRKINAGSRQQRTRVRKTIAAFGPVLARLAAIDEVFDHTLAGWSGQCFGQLGGVLTRHFMTLQATAADDQQNSARKDEPLSPARWQQQFCEDARQLLRAELDTRLQPVLGLLEACHSEVHKTP